MRLSKYQKTVIEQQPSPSPTVMKSSGILTNTGDNERVQHINPINKPGPQDIFFYKKKTGSNMHKRNHV